MNRLPFWLTMLAALVSPALLATGHAADHPSARTFDANGVKISSFVQGHGMPVVVIHGWHYAASINMVLPGISAALAKDHQVIAMDVRGHGMSDKPANQGAYGPELAEDVVRLLDHLHIKKAHLVGYSMGGIIVANFLAKHPNRVLSGTLGGMGWLKTGGVAQFGFERIGKNDPNAKAVALCGRSLATLALTQEQIKSIRVPVTILVGDRDNLVKRLYLEPLKVVRKDWPVTEIEDANHITCIVRPQFRQEIVAWIKKNNPAEP
jgi:pimeloyl-ACP methyl ester carboxylesterase